MFVLLDTNVWLSSLTSEGFCRRVTEASASRCVRVTTPYLCTEIAEKLAVKFRWSQAEVDSTIKKLQSLTLLRPDVSAAHTPELRDPDDQPILAAAVSHGCQFLVTGDKDLLVLKEFSGVEIVTVREFASRLGLNVD